MSFMAGCTSTKPLLATKGKLLFSDNFTGERGKKPLSLDNGWTVRAGMGLWEKKDGVYRSTWKPGIGHTPVMSYQGMARDLIIECTFRFGPLNPECDWHTQCMRIAVDNRTLYTGHVLSAWANPNNDFIETGLLLQNIQKKPDKTIIKDTLLDRQPLSINPNTWHTAVLEIVGNETLFRVDNDYIAYAQLDEVNVDKTLISITLGKTWHELKQINVWEALPNPQWKSANDKALSGRQPFKPTPHAYK